MKRYNEETEKRMVRFYRSLDESSQRRYAAMESSRLGHGGKKYIKKLLGTSYPRILRGLIELESEDFLGQTGRIRKEGGGRKGKKTTLK